MAYEAGYNNASWRAQNHNSTLAAGYLRRNPFMPYAASQVAMADSIAGAPGGVMPGMYGTPNAVARQSAPPPQPTLADQYQEGYDKYKLDTEKNRADVLRGYDDQRDEVISLLTAQGGPPTEAEIRLANDRRIADARMVEQGITSSTLGDEQRAGFDRAKANMNFDQRLQVADRLRSVSGNKLNTMENTQFVAPDMNQLIALEQAKGKGSTENLDMPQGGGGAPRVYGNPYGMGPQGGGGGYERPVQFGNSGDQVAYVDENGIPRNAFGGAVQTPASIKQNNRMASYGESRKKTKADTASRLGYGTQKPAPFSSYGTPVNVPSSVTPFMRSIPKPGPFMGYQEQYRTRRSV